MGGIGYLSGAAMLAGLFYIFRAIGSIWRRTGELEDEQDKNGSKPSESGLQWAHQYIMGQYGNRPGQGPGPASLWVRGILCNLLAALLMKSGL